MSETNKPTRGGARPNAGAPKKDNPAKSRTIRLTDDDWLKLKELGGVEWLRLYLNNKIKLTTTYSKNT